MNVSLVNCELCPRRCRVNRAAGQRGFCGAGAEAEIYRFGPHHGEEPPVSGTRGSGTVFFSRCTMRCLYCQNYPWSQEGRGQAHSVEGLADIFRGLKAKGCHNLNLVSPTPWLPVIEPAIELANEDGHPIPVVYNTSGYERVETLARYEGLADVYLTDLRYARPESAEEGSRAPDYVETARAALREMRRQTGPLRVDADGAAAAGTICRILALPGRADEAVENLRWIADNFGDGVAVSVMAQYLPAYRAVERPPWNRRVNADEYARVCEAVERFGLASGWVQEYHAEAAEEWVGFRMTAGGN